MLFYDTKFVVPCCDLCVTSLILPSAAFLLVVQGKSVILDHQNKQTKKALVKRQFKENLNIFNSLAHGQ